MPSESRKGARSEQGLREGSTSRAVTEAELDDIVNRLHGSTTKSSRGSICTNKVNTPDIKNIIAK